MIATAMAQPRLADLDALARAYGFDPARLPAPVREALQALIADNGLLAQALEDAETLADRDPLVGALNRRAFLRELQRLISYVERYRIKAAVLYMDLNGFKGVNDLYGHAAGDAVLRHVARLLLTHVRDSDVVGRLGGDEFGVILAQASAEEAFTKATSLAALFAETVCVFEGVEHRVGASIGVHALTGLEDAEAALSRADEAMYATKAAVRRRA